MDIQGLQKLTLLDYPGRTACTVFLGGCNFRCPFCHNGDIVESGLEPELSGSEFFDFLKKRQGLLDGVCVSGGEPTLRPELPEFLGEIKSMGFLVKLDTNGSKPELIKKLCEEKLLDYIAMDVKNCPSRYAETAGLKKLGLVPFNESLNFLLKGSVDYELRTTAVREFHDEKAFREIGEWIRGAKRYFIQAFVDRDTVLRRGLSTFTKEELLHFADIVKPYVNHVELRGV